jgi:ribosomal protein S18 acetylase RimI-like enzyme
MILTYQPATPADIEPLFQWNRWLISTYETNESLDLDRVLRWVRRKLESSINSYTVILADGVKAGYYRFDRDEDGTYELDDLYLSPDYQGRGIGTEVIRSCLASVHEPVRLYVFIRNTRALSLYRRLGFEVAETVGDSRYIMIHPNRPYYAAYDDRYRIAHDRGVSWASDEATPIVIEMLKKYRVTPDQSLLEIGCGEGRDARAVLDAGYSLLATDLSEEAIAYCRRTMPRYASHFSVLDCLADTTETRYDFMYSVAVIHMLVCDEDRDGFYRFIREHLKPGGVALICSMGDGDREFQTDVSTAFTLQEREHPSGSMMVTGTSCRMVSFRTLEDELSRNGLEILEEGLTSALPEFNSLLFAVVRGK